MNVRKILGLALCLCLLGNLSGKTKAESAAALDIDLTAMSGTMVYSIVYDMVWNPGNYVGKTIKMSGIYARYTSDDTGTLHHACVVQDATACCAQGIDFELADGAAYPEPNTEITVIGTLDTYRNENIQLAPGIDPAQYGIVLDICILRNAELTDW